MKACYWVLGLLLVFGVAATVAAQSAIDYQSTDGYYGVFGGYGNCQIYPEYCGGDVLGWGSKPPTCAECRKGCEKQLEAALELCKLTGAGSAACIAAAYNSYDICMTGCLEAPDCT